MGVIADQAWYFDGLLIKAGRGRLMDLPIGELLSFAWSEVYGNADQNGKRQLTLLSRGLLGAEGGEIIYNENLPESLQGKEAPPGWDADYDPMADTWALPSPGRDT